ncbi:MAG: peptide ABC transporter substrate-binding protein [Bacteriovoracia bacterium]
MRNGISKFFIGVAALALITACTKKETAVQKGTQNQVFHKGNGTEVQELDPHIVTGVPEHNIISALFEGLVDEDPVDLHPVPGMAESWTISPDKKTYTFKIRKGAKWSNGDAFTAHDFVYGWKRVLSPALAGEYAYMLFYVKNAEAYNQKKITDFSQVGVKALDDHTLQVVLHSPTPFFLSLLQHYSTFPAHQKTIEKFGAIDARGTKWTRPENMVSNGPFTLKTWELNKIITVVKNPNYWDAAVVKLNEINFYPTEQIQTEERMFRSGDLHVTEQVPLNKIEVYKKDEPNLIRIDPYLGTYYYRFNVTKAPFDNEKVRRAFSMSIDRKLIVERVTKGGQMPANAFVPPNTAGYTSRARVPDDIEAAKKLMAEAGYADGKNFPKAEIVYNTSESHKIIAEALQQMWKKNLGVDVQLTNQDWKVYLNSQKTLAYNLSRAGWIGDYPDPNTFMDMFVTNGGNNQTGWSSKQYDDYIRQAGLTDDQAKRYEIFQKAEELLMKESPILPIYTYTSVYLLSPDVKGWNPTIVNHHPWKHVYLEASEKNTKLSSN